MAKARGFTLTELMVTVAIVGIIAVLSGTAVWRYRVAAKRAEVTNALSKMAHATAAQYSNRRFQTGVNTFGADDRGTRTLCASASTPVPADVNSIQGKKYQSTQAEWSADVVKANKGFSCLRFSLNGPQFYQYDYTADQAAGTFIAKANGDLDGDGITSHFEIAGVTAGSDVNIAAGMKETTNGTE